MRTKVDKGGRVNFGWYFADVLYGWPLSVGDVLIVCLLYQLNERTLVLMRLWAVWIERMLTVLRSEVSTLWLCCRVYDYVIKFLAVVEVDWKVHFDSSIFTQVALHVVTSHSVCCLTAMWRDKLSDVWCFSNESTQDDTETDFNETLFHYLLTNIMLGKFFMYSWNGSVFAA